MTDKTTSAGQLHAILDQAYSMTTNKTAFDIWSGILKTEDTNKHTVTRKLCELITLFEIVRRDFDFLDNSLSQIGLDALSNIQTCIINHGLKTSWYQIKKEINKSDIDIIKMCDALLTSQGIGQNSLNQDQIAELIKQVNDLIAEFRASELPSELKFELIQELIKIQTALYNFDVTGESKLQQVCQEVYGDIIAKSSQNPKLYQKFIQPVQKLINTAVMIGGLMTTADLSLKYQPILTAQIVNFIKSLPDETVDQPLLEGVSDLQSMNAKIEEEANHKILTASEDE
ncbi:MAG: hypothetical protein AAGE84_00430 [Cyanobacteria bacterium P01_G01_bin.39]